jgi:hypothetical protein
MLPPFGFFGRPTSDAMMVADANGVKGGGAAANWLQSADSPHRV